MDALAGDLDAATARDPPLRLLSRITTHYYQLIKAIGKPTVQRKAGSKEPADRLILASEATESLGGTVLAA